MNRNWPAWSEWTAFAIALAAWIFFASRLNCLAP